MTKDELLRSKTFCILPFAQACIWQNGDVKPCCVNKNYTFGNIRNTPIEEIFSKNNKKLTDFRNEILQGEQLPESCATCTKLEQQFDVGSPRVHQTQSKNVALLDVIDISSAEALINNENIYMWDVRFSNLCNLKCRFCDPTSSSRVAEEELSLDPDYPHNINEVAINDPDAFFKFFEKHLDNITEIYFVGGEPLLMEYHYKILDLLVANNKFDVKLRYNTNFTILKFKNKHVLDDYWKYFKNITVSLSIDAGWEQYEYIRNGASWATVSNNLQELVSKTPHVYRTVGIVAMIFNVFHIRRLMTYLVKNEIVDTFYLMQVDGHPYYSISTLPQSIKDKVVEHYQTWINELYAPDHLKFSNIKSIRKQLQFIVDLAQNSDTSEHLKSLKYHITQKDNYRDENFYETFPELKDIFKDVRE